MFVSSEKCENFSLLQYISENGRWKLSLLNRNINSLNLKFLQLKFSKK
jgi:hypothetical protein